METTIEPEMPKKPRNRTPCVFWGHSESAIEKSELAPLEPSNSSNHTQPDQSSKSGSVWNPILDQSRYPFPCFPGIRTFSGKHPKTQKRSRLSRRERWLTRKDKESAARNIVHSKTSDAVYLWQPSRKHSRAQGLGMLNLCLNCLQLGSHKK